MSRAGNAIRRAIRSLERDGGNQVFTWDGTDYPCVENTAESSRVLGIGGFALDADLSLFVRLEALPSTLPQDKHDVFTFQDKQYRLDKSAKLWGGTVIKFNLMATTKGA